MRPVLRITALLAWILPILHCTSSVLVPPTPTPTETATPTTVPAFSVTTGVVTEIGYATATAGGEVLSGGASAVISRGVCWGTSPNPTILDSKTADGAGLGSFVSSLSGLTPETLYYVRAYATNSEETVYGAEVSFTTNLFGAATVSTTAISNQTAISASSGGTIAADNGSAVTARGVVWGTSAMPTTALPTKTTDGAGIGTFTSSITGLSCATTYYVRAYATNTAGTAYGNQLIFSTSSPLPDTVTIAPSSYAVVTGTPVTYSITTPVPDVTYQWKKNGSSVGGATGATHTYAPANNDNIKCTVTSTSPTCSASKDSNTITMIVYTTGTACAGTPTVVHGGMTYNTVQIGTQCWLRENMNIGTRIDVTSAQTNNPTIEKYCYNNDPNNCNVYGGLYQWAEMVQYLSGVTNTTHWNPLPVGNVQGICPAGWHIPTDAERLTLVTAMGGNTLAGGAMKEIGLAHWGPLYNVGATNQYGFTALPGGYAGNGSSYFIRENATFWTTEKGTLANAAQFFGASSADDWIVGGENFKTTGLSVRCLKD